jgi:hypothetical protein
MYFGRDNLVPAAGSIITENFVDPSTAGTFTWVNQGSATISETPGNFLMSFPAGGNNVRIRSILTPLSGPFTITMAFQPQVNNRNFQTFGIMLRDSTGRIMTWSLGHNGSWQWRRIYWNSITSYNSSADASNVFRNHVVNMVWLRLVNDGSLLRCQWSLDNGNTFGEYRTDAQFGFLSDFNEYGFGGDATSSVGTFYCNVVSFEAT